MFNLNELRDVCHKAAENWWKDLKTGQDLRVPNDDGSLKFNVPEKLCLIHSEISEAMEGYRKNLNDDHLPHMKMLDVELADAVIRIMDLCGAMNIDIDRAVKEKLAYNAKRADHKPENRLKCNGKRF